MKYSEYSIKDQKRDEKNPKREESEKGQNVEKEHKKKRLTLFKNLSSEVYFVKGILLF